VGHLKEYLDIDNHILKLGSLMSDQEPTTQPQPELVTSAGSSFESSHFVPTSFSNGFHVEDDNSCKRRFGRLGGPEYAFARKAAGGKRRRGSQENQGNSVQDLTMQLDTMKLVSNVAQKIRVHASVLMWTVMVPAALLQPAIDFAKEFWKTSKGKNMGSPHVQIWRMVL
jgi:hypothetical protein